MEYTTNYNLAKPSTTDTADISVLNSNMDIIDGAMKENVHYVFEFDITPDGQGGYTGTAREGATYANIMAALNATPAVYAKCYLGDETIFGIFNNIGSSGTVAFNTTLYTYVEGTGYFFMAVRGLVTNTDHIYVAVAPISTPTN